MDTIDPVEKQRLGDYALRWNHITDWHRIVANRWQAKRGNKQANPSIQPLLQNTPQENSTNSLITAQDQHSSKQTEDRARPTDTSDKTTAKKRIKTAVSASQEVIASATTVFPFTLFPNTVSVDRTHLILVRRFFFRVASIKNIKIEDIMTVSPSIGLFFGSLKFTVIFVDDESPYIINYLPRNEALRISRILKGYKIALEKGVDCSSLSNQELESLLNKMCEDGTETEPHKGRS